MRSGGCKAGCLLIAGLFVLGGCGANSEDVPSASISAPSDATRSLDDEVRALAAHGDVEALVDNPPATPAPILDLHPEVLITTNLGEIRVRLDAEKAPETVDNFLTNYVTRGSYEGTIFHFVEPDYIIAAGGFTADLQPIEPRAPIRSEAGNGLKNLRGTIAMTHQAEYADSATSQFFINLVDNAHLDQDASSESSGYCVFGKVISGLDVVDAIAAVPVRQSADFSKLPSSSVLIRSIVRVD